MHALCFQGRGLLLVFPIAGCGARVRGERNIVLLGCGGHNARYAHTLHGAPRKRNVTITKTTLCCFGRWRSCDCSESASRHRHSHKAAASRTRMTGATWVSTTRQVPLPLTPWPRCYLASGLRRSRCRSSCGGCPGCAGTSADSSGWVRAAAVLSSRWVCIAHA